jgi:hypothetical protein
MPAGVSAPVSPKPEIEPPPRKPPASPLVHYDRDYERLANVSQLKHQYPSSQARMRAGPSMAGLSMMANYYGFSCASWRKSMDLRYVMSQRLQSA